MIMIIIRLIILGSGSLAGAPLMEGTHAASSGSGPPLCMVEVEFTRKMSMLLVPNETMSFPPLGKGEHYVIEIYASGFKWTVVERTNNIIDHDEARQHLAAVHKAMVDELQRWSNLEAFKRMRSRASRLSSRHNPPFL